ncbi:MAG: cytochrome d ubiquinol oxidase subunit II [Prevotella sp.]
MSYELLQQYWWFLVSLLGALLTFMMFVQGANALMFFVGYNKEGRRKIVNSTGRRWELTFTTLVTFGGAFFASFPLFYSTSFGGAYWLWTAILLTFVLQAVSYEFQTKLGNLLGEKTFQAFLVLNGIAGPLLLGVAVATLFNGADFVIDKGNLLSGGNPIISRWTGAAYGLEAFLDVWNILFGLAVMFLAQVLGLLYIINSVADENIRSRASVRLVGCLVLFLATFLVSLGHILLMDGYEAAEDGMITAVPYKYLTNFTHMWPVLVGLVLGVALFLYGTFRTVFSATYTCGFWPSSLGAVLVVLSLLLVTGLNNTAYYPSLHDIQSSLTITNSCSSPFTLGVMAVVSLLIPFVLAYIIYAWRKISAR